MLCYVVGHESTLLVKAALQHSFYTYLLLQLDLSLYITSRLLLTNGVCTFSPGVLCVNGASVTKRLDLVSD